MFEPSEDSSLHEDLRPADFVQLAMQPEVPEKLPRGQQRFGVALRAARGACGAQNDFGSVKGVLTHRSSRRSRNCLSSLDLILCRAEEPHHHQAFEMKKYDV